MAEEKFKAKGIDRRVRRKALSLSTDTGKREFSQQHSNMRKTPSPSASKFVKENPAPTNPSPSLGQKRRRMSGMDSTTMAISPVAIVFGQMGFDTPTNKATQEPDSLSQADRRSSWAKFTEAR